MTITVEASLLPDHSNTYNMIRYDPLEYMYVPKMFDDTSDATIDGAVIDSIYALHYADAMKERKLTVGNSDRSCQCLAIFHSMQWVLQ